MIMEKLGYAETAMDMAMAVYGVVEKYYDHGSSHGGDEHYDDHKEPEMPEWIMAIQQGMMGLMQ